MSECGKFEKRTKDSYQMIDWNQYYKVYLKKQELGIKSKWDFSGSGSETRTYDLIPKHKMFDFLRKAFEQSIWFKATKFQFINCKEHYTEKGICYIKSLYWDYELCGYVLRVLYYHINKHNEKEYNILTIKDINCLEPIDYVFDEKCIKILEKNK
jgi:hypothetical protein